MLGFSQALARQVCRGGHALCSLQAPVEPKLLVQGLHFEQQQLVLRGFPLHRERPAHSFPLSVLRKVP